MKIPPPLAFLAALVCAANACFAQLNTAANAPRQVVVVLLDGSRLLGTMPATAAFSVQAGSFAIPVTRIDSITISDDRKKVTVALANGDHIDGVVPATPQPFTTLLGTIPLDLHVVKSLTVLATTGAAGIDGLVFSNSLGSDTDLAHSIVGPAIKPYTDAKNGYHTPGQHDFAQGEHGKAVTIKGTYQNDEWIHMLTLDGLDQLINPEEGTIEFSYCQKAPPMDWSYGVYRMFDGEAGLGACVNLFAARNTIFFNIICGGQSRGFTCPISVFPNNEWLHVAVVWNRKGIEGTAETMRLCINGTEVASGNANDWGAVPGGRADIAGGQNANCAGKYFMSDLKIWKRAISQAPPPGQAAWQPPAPSSGATPGNPQPANAPPPPGRPAKQTGPTPPPFGTQLPPQ